MNESYTYSKDVFEKTCEICKSIFEVSCLGQKGHEEKEEYYCPVCRKEYYCRASNSPRVKLIKKNENYQK